MKVSSCDTSDTGKIMGVAMVSPLQDIKYKWSFLSSDTFDTLSSM
jgi:hypothetical protein